MNGLYSLIIAVSMYSKIPMPAVSWERERMGYVMCWFPVVGVAEGILLTFWCIVGNKMNFPYIITAIVGAALPLLLTGGIHMDGFLDTVDARSSYGDREKKLEILKDPHIGAFGVIGSLSYLLLYLGAMALLAWKGVLWAAGPVFIMERALSGLSVVFFPCAKNSGLAAAFSDGAKRRAAGLACLAWAAAAGAWMGLLGGWACALGLAAVQLGCLGAYYRMALKEFGGITGDLAGYFLQVSEAASLWWLAVWASVLAV